MGSNSRKRFALHASLQYGKTLDKEEQISYTWKRRGGGVRVQIPDMRLEKSGASGQRVFTLANPVWSVGVGSRPCQDIAGAPTSLCHIRPVNKTWRGWNNKTCEPGQKEFRRWQLKLQSVKLEMNSIRFIRVQRSRRSWNILSVFCSLGRWLPARCHSYLRLISR